MIWIFSIWILLNEPVRRPRCRWTMCNVLLVRVKEKIDMNRIEWMKNSRVQVCSDDYKIN